MREICYFLLLLVIGIILMPILFGLLLVGSIKGIQFFPPSQAIGLWLIMVLMPYISFQLARLIIWANKQANRHLLIGFIISITINIFLFLVIGILKGIIPLGIERTVIVDTESSWGFTHSTLIQISTFIHHAKMKKNLVPQNEEDVNRILLSEPKFRKMLVQNLNFKNPLKEGLYYVDAWGNQLRYKYLGKNDTGEESFIIYSYGPNGIDEKGEGDDVSIRYP